MYHREATISSLPFPRGAIGDDPRDIAVCKVPDDQVVKQTIIADSTDCVEIGPIKGRMPYVAARVTKKRRLSDILSSDKPSSREHSAQKLKALRSSYDTFIEAHSHGDLTLSIANKGESPIVRREINSQESSINARNGHIYTVCLENEHHQALVLSLFSGL